MYRYSIQIDAFRRYGEVVYLVVAAPAKLGKVFNPLPHGPMTDAGLADFLFALGFQAIGVTQTRAEVLARLGEDDFTATPFVLAVTVDDAVKRAMALP